MFKEEFYPEQQERSPSLVQEEPEPPLIKEEQEELLQRPEEADGTILSLLAVKSEDIYIIITALKGLSQQMTAFEERLERRFHQQDEKIEQLRGMIDRIGAAAAENSTNSILPAKRIKRAKNSKLAVSEIFLHIGAVCVYPRREGLYAFMVPTNFVNHSVCRRW